MRLAIGVEMAVEGKPLTMIWSKYEGEITKIKNSVCGMDNAVMIRTE